ncbi:carbohydrate kinase family protein [Pseudoflavonifractor phocaeensis]|uniref:carbohydrate kinase family protein n=1 Tax=Pseudoflavonifractor phocaeensis TaxID=1870988 RepID=UPI00195736F1|nr:carbohydrate kinase [Pseudoflavonifractor phocaeensis]MBM6869058.1 carbohydrate kinase [Pseudoflavonifractor phocaeensis]
MKDLIAVGEVLIDLTQTGVNEAGVRQYAANPGGAPANVAVAAARLGARTAFVGKVGQDTFGDTLRQVLVDNGVDVSGMYGTDQAPTTLAVVSVDPSGDRSFTFYRSPGADILLTPAEAEDALTEGTKFLHFGSVSLTADPSRSATLAAAKKAKSMGALVSYDPNYRANLWSDEATAVTWMKEPVALCDVVKLSEEELPLLTGTADLAEGTRRLVEQGVTLVLVTLGGEGAYYRVGEETGMVPGVATKVADTNGAGDTFLGAVLSRLVRRGEAPLDGLNGKAMEEILTFANRAASLTCSRSGAIPAMPTLEELGE